MKKAIITYVDDNMIDNVLSDFIPSLYKEGCYTGDLHIIYYSDKQLILPNKKIHVHNMPVNKDRPVHTYRNSDVVDLLGSIDATHVVVIDGGDVWFQNDINKLFEFTKDNIGVCTEPEEWNTGFSGKSVNKLPEPYLDPIRDTLGDNLIHNSGMVAGKISKVKKFLFEVSVLVNLVCKPFFGLDQIMFNYRLISNETYITLSNEYNYSLISHNKVEGILSKIKNKCIIHNTGGDSRLFRGRKECQKKMK